MPEDTNDTNFSLAKEKNLIIEDSILGKYEFFGEEELINNDPVRGFSVKCISLHGILYKISKRVNLYYYYLIFKGFFSVDLSKPLNKKNFKIILYNKIVNSIKTHPKLLKNIKII